MDTPVYVYVFVCTRGYSFDTLLMYYMTLQEIPPSALASECRGPGLPRFLHRQIRGLHQARATSQGASLVPSQRRRQRDNCKYEFCLYVHRYVFDFRTIIGPLFLQILHVAPGVARGVSLESARYEQPAQRVDEEVAEY